MKNIELNEMFKLLPTLRGLTGSDFWLTVSRAEDQLKSEIKHLQTALDNIEGIANLKKEHKDLFEKYSVKDEKGNSFIEEKNKNIFYEQTIAIDNKFSSTLKEVSEFWEKENPIVFPKLKEEYIPKNINGEQFKFVKYLL